MENVVGNVDNCYWSCWEDDCWYGRGGEDVSLCDEMVNMVNHVEVYHGEDRNCIFRVEYGVSGTQHDHLIFVDDDRFIGYIIEDF